MSTSGRYPGGHALPASTTKISAPESAPGIVNSLPPAFTDRQFDSLLASKMNGSAAARGNHMADDSNVRWGTGNYEGLVADPGKGWRTPTPSELATRVEDVSDPAHPSRTTIPLSTTSDVPGREVTGHVSFVRAIKTMDAGVGARKVGEGQLLYQILNVCEERLVSQAIALGADAIVGVTVSWVSGNVGGMTIGTAAGRGDKVSVCLTGTAVTLAP